jgi:hypothetical protein
MGDHYCIDQPTGTLAIWKGGTDLGPVFNPGAYPTRVRFNSTLENIGFLRTPRTGSYTNNGWPTTDPDSKKVTLFAHGQSYRPFLFGRLRVAGVDLPINGSIFHHYSGMGFFSYTIGADATHVYLNIMRSNKFGVGPVSPTITYEIYLSVYGVNANGTLRRPPYFNGVDTNAGAATPYVKAGYFSTEYRYPYRDSAGVFSVPNERTISAGIGWTGGSALGYQEAVGLGYRYSVRGHVVQRNATNIASFVAGAVGNDASANFAVTRMSI